MTTSDHMVDVRDFGAFGNGITDDHAAFVAADKAAQGRVMVVTEGTYKIGADLTIAAPVRFTGTLTKPVAQLVEAARAALNYLENTEGEFGITLESATNIRAALAQTGGE